MQFSMSFIGAAFYFLISVGALPQLEEPRDLGNGSPDDLFTSEEPLSLSLGVDASSLGPLDEGTLVATAGDIPLYPDIDQSGGVTEDFSDEINLSPLDENLDSTSQLLFLSDDTGAIANGQISSCLSPGVRKRQLTNSGEGEDSFLGRVSLPRPIFLVPPR